MKNEKRSIAFAKSSKKILMNLAQEKAFLLASPWELLFSEPSLFLPIILRREKIQSNQSPALPCPFQPPRFHSVPSTGGIKRGP
jgi:hypothetical protein